MKCKQGLDHVLMGWNGLQLRRVFKHHTCNHFAASQDHCWERAQNHTRCILKLFIVLASSLQKSQLQTLSSLVPICTQGGSQPFLIKWFSLQVKLVVAAAASLRFFLLSHSGPPLLLYSRVSMRISSTQYMYLGGAGCQKSTWWINPKRRQKATKKSSR